VADINSKFSFQKRNFDKDYLSQEEVSQHSLIRFMAVVAWHYMVLSVLIIGRQRGVGGQGDRAPTLDFHIWYKYSK